MHKKRANPLRLWDQVYHYILVLVYLIPVYVILDRDL